MKKVLIICLHRENRSPGQRYRYEQYLPFLRENGYEFQLSPLLNARDDKTAYSKGRYFKKGWIYLKTWFVRFRDWMRMNKYDIIFIYRDALITRSTFFEKRFSRSRAKVIYDFDDAIWLPSIAAVNKKFDFMKNPGKTSVIIGYADGVIAGNKYLADYARRFNENVTIIPSTIDTDSYKVPAKWNDDAGAVCIGWTGSVSTIQHFALAIPALKRIKERFGSKVKFKIIGDPDYYCEELDVRGVRWSASTEVSDLSELDIGIMPLPDDEWSKGKCGMKGLQYMALGIATLMSPVGVNTDIIQQGQNGFLPETEDEWVEMLSRLITDRELRMRIGAAGRKTIEEKYSVSANKHKYLEEFNRLIADN
jgi:glycosyltransferase involved in cell wall biosynthesis